MKPLILQTDFGYADGAVSAMYGVAACVSDELRVFDLTHDIPQYDIWEASYRLIQTVSYWPEGSVFVSVVDPGVGSTRRSIVVRTANNQYIVTPDNGTLTHVRRMIGITDARVIDETANRLPGSGESYTFHGRDIYAYTGARLAAGIISFGQVGPAVPADSINELPVVEAIAESDHITGTIDVLDVRFGSLWTNIPRALRFDSVFHDGVSFYGKLKRDSGKRFYRYAAFFGGRRNHAVNAFERTVERRRRLVAVRKRHVDDFPAVL